MEFGRVAPNQLKKMDLALPADPPVNALQLKAKKSGAQQVYVGCAKWGIREWVGKLYPAGTKESAFLDEYVKNFNALELNATHYKLYSASEIKPWTDKTKA